MLQRHREQIGTGYFLAIIKSQCKLISRTVDIESINSQFITGIPDNNANRPVGPCDVYIGMRQPANQTNYIGIRGIGLRIVADNVISISSPEHIGVRASISIQDVIPRTAIKNITPLVSVQVISAVAAQENVVSGCAIQRVVAQPPTQRIITGTTSQGVVAVISGQTVVPIRAIQIVVPTRP